MPPVPTGFTEPRYTVSTHADNDPCQKFGGIDLSFRMRSGPQLSASPRSIPRADDDFEVCQTLSVHFGSKARRTA